MKNLPRHSLKGFTLIELIAIIGILAGLLRPALANAQRRAKRIQCVNNLRQVALSARMWATDNSGRFPWTTAQDNGGTRGVTDIVAHFGALSNELNTPRILICPSDGERSATRATTHVPSS